MHGSQLREMMAKACIRRDMCRFVFWEESFASPGSLKSRGRKKRRMKSGAVDSETKKRALVKSVRF